MKATVDAMPYFRLLPRYLILATILFISTDAHSQEPDHTVETANATVDYGIELYLDGRLREAKIALQSASATALDPASQNEALIYLAEIEYYLGERDAAWLTCQRIVANDENYRPDPLIHPPEMLVFFETARIATVEPATSREPTNNPSSSDTRFSLTSLVPGVPQYMRGNRGLGMATGLTFATLSVSSIALWAALRTYDLDDSKQGIQVHNSDNEAAAQRLLTLTELTRLGASGIWIATALQELVIRPNFVLAGEHAQGSISVTGRW